MLIKIRILKIQSLVKPKTKKNLQMDIKKKKKLTFYNKSNNTLLIINAKYYNLL